MKKNKDRILVFIPMYNCAKQIPRVLAQFDERTRAVVDHVLVVNNRSTDQGESVAAETVRKIEGLAATVVRNHENYGLGGSHKVAFRYAIEHNYDYVVVLHGDDQGDIRDVVPLLEQGVHRDVDCLLGARFHPGSKLPGYSAFRTFGNRAYNLLFSAALRRRIYDLGSGLNLYRVDVLRNGFFEKFPDDLTFNYCMIMAHASGGHRIQFFPIVWREDDQVSNVRLFSQAKRVLALLLAYMSSPQRFLGSDRRTVKHESYQSDIVTDNTAGFPQATAP